MKHIFAIVINPQPLINNLQLFVPDANIRDCFYKSKSFQHFDYALELVRDCSARVGMVIPDVVKVKENTLQRNVVVKIVFLGEVSKNNLKLVAKRKGNV